MGNAVLITGCSSGFGLTAASTFRQAGWNVVATMRDPSRWLIAEHDSEILVAPLDVRDVGSIDAALALAVDRFGQLDCVVNNAGQALVSAFEVTPIAAVRALFETNTFGVMQVIQSVLPHFRRRGRGCIVNVTSSAAITPDPMMTAYDASKWAVDGFTEALRYELQPLGVAVKLVQPGMVPTTNIVRTTMERSSEIPVPPAYKAFFDQTYAMYMARAASEELATEIDVAQAILAAATNADDRLRYVVGSDAQMAARMRRETSEDEYMAWARSRFGASTK